MLQRKEIKCCLPLFLQIIYVLYFTSVFTNDYDDHILIKCLASIPYYFSVFVVYWTLPGIHIYQLDMSTVRGLWNKFYARLWIRVKFYGKSILLYTKHAACSTETKTICDATKSVGLLILWIYRAILFIIRNQLAATISFCDTGQFRSNVELRGKVIFKDYFCKSASSKDVPFL